jgi:hypothetical protein
VPHGPVQDVLEVGLGRGRKAHCPRARPCGHLPRVPEPLPEITLSATAAR